jgi:hypothetical protein
LKDFSSIGQPKPPTVAPNVNQPVVPQAQQGVHPGPNQPSTGSISEDAPSNVSKSDQASSGLHGAIEAEDPAAPISSAATDSSVGSSVGGDIESGTKAFSTGGGQNDVSKGLSIASKVEEGLDATDQFVPGLDVATDIVTGLTTLGSQLYSAFGPKAKKQQPPDPSTIETPRGSNIGGNFAQQTSLGSISSGVA